MMPNGPIDLDTITGPLIEAGLLTAEQIKGRLFRIEWVPHRVDVYLCKLDENGLKFRDPDNPDQVAHEVVSWPTVYREKP